MSCQYSIYFLGLDKYFLRIYLLQERKTSDTKIFPVCLFLFSEHTQPVLENFSGPLDVEGVARMISAILRRKSFTTHFSEK